MRGPLLLCLTLNLLAIAAPAQAQVSLFDRWFAAHESGRHADAERFIRAAIEDDKANNPLKVPSDYRALATTLKIRDKYEEAAQAVSEGIEWCRKYRGEDAIYGSLLSDRGSVAFLQGRYEEAERDYAASVKHFTKLVPADSYQILTPIVFLASTYQNQGRFAEAEQLLGANMRHLDPKDSVTGALYIIGLQTYSSIAQAQGRFDRAEYFSREAFVRSLELNGPSGSTADASVNLANIYRIQGRYQEAMPFYQQSLAFYLKLFSNSSSHVAGARMNMSTALLGMQRYDEALAQLQPALEAYRQLYQRDHYATATCLVNLGATLQGLKRLPEAEAAYREALAIRERLAGPDSPPVARVIARLTQVLRDTGRHDEALALLDRAAKIRDKFATDPELAARSTMVKAQVLWAQDKHDEAIETMQKAMTLAEEQRGLAAGAGVERAAMFGGYWEIFEQMVAWQAERGNVDQALRTIERWRARSFLEELAVSGADMLAGYSSDKRKQLIQRETQIREAIARLEHQVDLLERSARQNPADQNKAEQAQRELENARQALYQHSRDTRSQNPVYRNLISQEQVYAGVDRIRELLGDDSGMALAYLIGSKQSFVIAVTKSDAMITELAFDAAQAEKLDVPMGNVTRVTLGNAFITPTHDGIIDQIGNKEGTTLTSRLHALWHTLIPSAQRELLTSGKISRLILIPDGPLSLLPFEALVVQSGDDPEYLLDVGPPIVYGPSATVLSNLTERSADPATMTERVLTVGDPDYGPPSQLNKVERQMPLRSARSRLNLARLPYSGTESQWVAEVFNKSQMPVMRLSGRQASEANVRKSITGREIVHLACHGMSDTANGNFFGALAVAAGNVEDPSNDGMLQLVEIYSLNLRSCELAILSACMTNHGPQQHGEGVWALSRGFLVAGARRVVASNWVVDDQAGATLISYYANFLGRAGQDRTARDYAKGLHEAKRLVRKQEKWSHPFYWSGLVHVGPK